MYSVKLRQGPFWQEGISHDIGGDVYGAVCMSRGFAWMICFQNHTSDNFVQKNLNLDMSGSFIQEDRHGKSSFKWGSAFQITSNSI